MNDFEHASISSRVARLSARGFAVLIAANVMIGVAHSSPNDLREAYQRADRLYQNYRSKAFKLNLEAHWIAGSEKLWYRNDLAKGRKEFWVVETSTGKKTPAFDATKLAEALSHAAEKKVDPASLPFSDIDFIDEGKVVQFDAFGSGWKVDLATYATEKTKPRQRQRPQGEAPWIQDTWEANRANQKSPDGQWTARIVDHNVTVRSKDGKEFQLTHVGSAEAYFSRLEWTPDSKRIIATRVMPGDRKPVYLLESSKPGTTRAVLHTRLYDQPGDKVDSFDQWVLDPEAKTELRTDAETVDYGDLPSLRWKKDSRHYTYEKMDRGYGRWRVIEVDSVTGKSKALVDDDPATFVDSTNQYTYYCESSEDIIWRSERDGWGHLYLSDGNGKIVNQITKGPWVVRSVRFVDEQNKVVFFDASGVNPGEDPYFLHTYRVNFDGSGLTALTPSKGTHQVQLSPDRKFLVDTYSTVQDAPVHELRSATTGALVTKLEEADISELKAIHWRAPEPFVAKGRDGKTDIYGVVYRPSNFDPRKKYPIIEDIYAGPQDSFVPKAFSPCHWSRTLSELGFIVVQIDGMGTRNRSKAFHDVCYKNLADAGFPDRILWMKALAAKYSYVDTSRVGVYGTSAGGQSSTGAVLFHPEFYKVAVSSCGCHDNRIDKLWWNEQWMGYPVTKEYDEQSNITNASKLKGNLMLMVGELDSNVPPESTFRLADALIKANKEFELVVLPGLNHTSGGAFGERKRRDFFVRHLLGVQPPAWNIDK